MTTHIRFAAPAAILVIMLVVAACEPASIASPAPSQPAASSSHGAVSDSEGLASYIAGMCPIFDALLAIDPRVGSLRASAADGGDMTAKVPEMESLGETMLVLLTELEGLPDWEPGRGLRYHLITALHGIRATMLHVIRNPSASDAAEDITAMPFIATDALDRAMDASTQGGLRCEGVE